MKLFLSSENLGKYASIFVELAGPKKSVLYVGNAKDYLTNDERTAKVIEHKAQFENLGLKFTELDLRNHFVEKVQPGLLDAYGAVWCSGGNTFLLRSAMKISGFDELLKSEVLKGSIAYGGSSAGAIVAGPTLQGTELGDDPSEVRGLYGSNIIWSGLAMVSVVCVPHCDSDWFGASAKLMIAHLEDTKTPYIALNDGQVYLVNDSDERLLS